MSNLPTFDELPGNDQLINRVQYMLSQENFPHCALLTGAEGSGVFPFSRAITASLICQNSENKPCGNCKQCQLFLRNVHADIHYTFPIIKNRDHKTSNSYRKKWNEFITKSTFLKYQNWIDYMDASRKQGIIPVSEINDITHFAQMHSYEVGPKILIIWKADLLGENGNRLLKLIEEPPNEMYIILIAESSDNLLNTIVSRAQHFHFSIPDKDQTIAILSERFSQYDNNKIEQAALMAEGNIAHAVDILVNEQTEHSKMLVPWLRDCYAADAKNIFKWAEEFKSFSREEQKQFWDYFLHFLREVQRLCIGSNTVPRLSAEELKSANKISELVNIEAIDRIHNAVNQSVYAIERNGRPDLTLIAASFRVHRAFHLNS